MPPLLKSCSPSWDHSDSACSAISSARVTAVSCKLRCYAPRSRDLLRGLVIAMRGASAIVVADQQELRYSVDCYTRTAEGRIRNRNNCRLLWKGERALTKLSRNIRWIHLLTTESTILISRSSQKYFQNE